MDQRLLSWGRAVKQRENKFAPLWYFTDSGRAPDPLPTIAGLPRFRAGVVFRHDDAPNRAALAAEVAKLCKSRGITLVIAGNTRLAARLGAGVHLRGGRRPDHFWPRGLVTSSAHDGAEIRRARLSGAEIVFISPVFATASHPGERCLGPVKWARLARLAGGSAYALGGITGGNIRRLRAAKGVGAITALSR
jgi:thiamine-phosphate pyrophosphorylase